MEQQNNNSSTGCLDIFMAALAILFITLRLTHVINWAWYWVLAPIWAWVIIYVAYIIAGVWLITRKYKNSKNNQAKIMIYMRDLKNYKPETEFVPDEEPF